MFDIFIEILEILTKILEILVKLLEIYIKNIHFSQNFEHFRKKSRSFWSKHKRFLLKYRTFAYILIKISKMVKVLNIFSNVANLDRMSKMLVKISGIKSTKFGSKTLTL